MRIFADEGELVEKYRRLTDEGRARISNQIDAEVAAKRQAGLKPRRRLVDTMAVHRRTFQRIGMWSMHSGRRRI